MLGGKEGAVNNCNKTTEITIHTKVVSGQVKNILDSKLGKESKLSTKYQ